MTIKQTMNSLVAVLLLTTPTIFFAMDHREENPPLRHYSYVNSKGTKVYCMTISPTKIFEYYRSKKNPTTLHVFTSNRDQVTQLSRIGDLSTGLFFAGATCLLRGNTLQTYLNGSNMHKDSGSNITATSLNAAPSAIATAAITTAASALTAASSALFTAKACSNVTWQDIMRDKKTALCKYLLYGSLACACGLNIPQVVTASSNKIGAGVMLGGLGGTFATRALHHLTDVLTPVTFGEDTPGTNYLKSLGVDFK